MYVNDKNDMKGLEVLIDPYIHNKANISRDKFLEKTSNLKYLRTVNNHKFFSFYITSLYEYNNLIKFHDLVNKGLFDFGGYHVFAIGIKPKLYNWLKTTKITTIQKQITCWLASNYFYDTKNRCNLKRQIYKPMFEVMEEIISIFYKNTDLPDFKLLLDKLHHNQDETIFEKENECISKYLKVCKEYYGGLPPEFLSSPFNYSNAEDWGLHSYDFNFIEAYLSENDWDRIINNDSEDDMHRVESHEELLIKWKHTYSTFDIRRNFVYNFYFEPQKKEKTNRLKIPQKIKDQVWNRDNGKCTICGSNVRIEYDHIIPISKGGTNTYRNLQLLCESCNRHKSNKI